MWARVSLTWSEKMRRTTGTTLAPPTRTASEKRENSSPPKGAAAAAAGNPATFVLAAWEAASVAAGAAAARVWPAEGAMSMNPRSPHADDCMPTSTVPCMDCRMGVCMGGLHWVGG